MATRGKGWRNVLLMIRFLFAVSLSMDKLERMFFKLKHVKTNFCCSLGVRHLENILNIMEEGSSLKTFDQISAVKKWIIDKGAQPRRKDHVGTSHIILLK